MNITLPGSVLVLYVMQNCAGCKAVDPIFRQLANTEPRVKYAICDLTNAREIITMSHQTKTQLQKVPCLILYINGRPHARFKGDKNIPSLRNFCSNALAAAPRQQQQEFVQQGGNMYGGGQGYSQQPPVSQMPSQYRQQPNQAQQGQQGKDKFWMPELGKTPTMTGALRGGGGGTQYAYLGTVDDEDEDKLLVPNQVIPHNEPWMSQYKKIGTMD
jgi:hypothetical protein